MEDGNNKDDRMYGIIMIMKTVGIKMEGRNNDVNRIYGRIKNSNN